jgi:hypothetical protein
MRAILLRLLAIAVAATVLSASSCGSGNNGGGGSSSGVSNQSATGIWSGSDSVTGLGVTALIDSAGRATFIRSDGAQFVGSAQVSGTTLAVEVNGYSNFNSTFSDRSTYGIGTVDGTVMTGGTLTATLTFTTTGNTSITGNWTLNYAALSNDSSSTTAISGNYSDNVMSATLSITTTGIMSSQSSTTNCVLNGSVSTSDSTHNIYDVSYAYANCTGNYAVLNGVQFTGLATVDSSSSPALLTIAVTGASSSNKYGIVSNLTGS